MPEPDNVRHIFDAQGARDARDEAMARVDEHAEEEWKRAALDAIEAVATWRDEFTTDAVWWMLDHSGAGDAREARVMGPLMTEAARRGWIARTDRTHNSVRVECHANPKRVWKSLLR